MHYVYLLTSSRSPSRLYIGITANLKRRLTEHNSGKLPHTAQFKPWHLITYVAFSDKQKAARFERYLKSGSGTPLRIDVCGRAYLSAAGVCALPGSYIQSAYAIHVGSSETSK